MATSPLADFVAAVHAGRAVRGFGGLHAGALVDGVAPLAPSDPEAVTAEAYNQGVLGDDVAWDDALASVRQALA